MQSPSNDPPSEPLDPRALRTRALLHTAVLTLARSRDPSSISVSEVTRQAGLNRSTYYLHYSDVESLIADALETEVANSDAAWNSFADTHSTLNPRQPSPNIVAYLGYVHDNAELYRWALSARGSSLVQAQLRSRLTRSAHEGLSTFPLSRNRSGDTIERHAAFFGGASLGVLIEWLNSDTPESPAALANWLWREFLDPNRTAAVSTAELD